MCWWLDFLAGIELWTDYLTHVEVGHSDSRVFDIAVALPKEGYADTRNWILQHENG